MSICCITQVFDRTFISCLKFPSPKGGHVINTEMLVPNKTPSYGRFCAIYLGPSIYNHIIKHKGSEEESPCNATISPWWWVASKIKTFLHTLRQCQCGISETSDEEEFITVHDQLPWCKCDRVHNYYILRKMVH